MRFRGAFIVGWLAALAAAPALGQTPPPADPIDALLRRTPAPPDPEEPDTAATGSSTVEPEPALPPTPRPYVPRPPALTAPSFVQETGKAPDGPGTAADEAYDGRLRSSAASAQGFQGPLDGGWTLSDGARELYALQLVDRNGTIEGAWRDLRRPGALNASGFIDVVERSADGDLTFRFPGGAVAVLHAASVGWSGRLTEGDRSETIRMSRRKP